MFLSQAGVAPLFTEEKESLFDKRDKKEKKRGRKGARTFLKLSILEGKNLPR